MIRVQCEQNGVSLHLSCYDVRSLLDVAHHVDVGSSAAFKRFTTKLVCDSKSLTRLSNQYLARSRELIKKGRKEINCK